MNKRRGYIHIDLVQVLIAGIVVGTVVGALISVVLFVIAPWAWTFIKPIIHAWTA